MNKSVRLVKEDGYSEGYSVVDENNVEIGYSRLSHGYCMAYYTKNRPNTEWAKVFERAYDRSCGGHFPSEEEKYMALREIEDAFMAYREEIEE